MNPSESRSAVPQTAKPQPFKSKYKLQGMIAAVALMWLDYALIHHGLVANDPVAVGGGMILMLAGAAIAFFFG